MEMTKHCRATLNFAIPTNHTLMWQPNNNLVWLIGERITNDDTKNLNKKPSGYCFWLNKTCVSKHVKRRLKQQQR